MCASPLALKAHRVAIGYRLTSYPSLRADLEGKPFLVNNSLDSYEYRDSEVVVDENLITSQGPGTATHFALAIVEAIKGRKKTKEVAKGMLVFDY